MGALAEWYARHGRHELPWRAERDRWPILVSEVMLQQTQVTRVLDTWPAFIARFPTPDVMAAATAGDVITAWGRLGYPRRARRLWEAAVLIARDGWPDDLRALPGVGRYTAPAVLAQAEGHDVAAVEVNVRRVLERLAGRRLTDGAAEAAMLETGTPLRGRDRLLALMDLGALVCRARDPDCGACPVRSRCSTRGVLPGGETRTTQSPFAGSFRERRGIVLAALRDADTVPASDLDAEALASLVDDDLAVVECGLARLP